MSPLQRLPKRKMVQRATQPADLAYRRNITVEISDGNAPLTNAIAMVTADLDCNGIDDLVMNFGPDAGLWAWMNHDTWLFLHGLSPSGMIAGQLDEIAGDEIIATFPGWGMWRWSAGVWEQWHTLDGIPLAIGELDDLGPLGNDVLADFPGYGIYLFHGGAVPWRYINLLHTLSPRATVLADLDGDGTSELVASFPGYGVWVYRNNADGEKWTQLHGRDAVHLAAGEIDQTPGVDLDAPQQHDLVSAAYAVGRDGHADRSRPIRDR